MPEQVAVSQGLKTDLVTDTGGKRMVRLGIGGKEVTLELSSARKLGMVLMAWGTMAERASLNECQVCQGTGLRRGTPGSPGGGSTVSRPCLCLRGEVWRVIANAQTPGEMLGMMRWLQIK